jgi:hypothetical protein
MQDPVSVSYEAVQAWKAELERSAAQGDEHSAEVARDRLLSALEDFTAAIPTTLQGARLKLTPVRDALAGIEDGEVLTSAEAALWSEQIDSVLQGFMRPHSAD